MAAINQDEEAGKRELGPNHVVGCRRKRGPAHPQANGSLKGTELRT
jgi:hypothetical protein